MKTEINNQTTLEKRPFTFFEFFAGGGMARLGLGMNGIARLQMTGARKKPLRIGRISADRNSVSATLPN